MELELSNEEFEILMKIFIRDEMNLGEQIKKAIDNKNRENNLENLYKGINESKELCSKILQIESDQYTKALFGKIKI